MYVLASKKTLVYVLTMSELLERAKSQNSSPDKPKGGSMKYRFSIFLETSFQKWWKQYLHNTHVLAFLGSI